MTYGQARLGIHDTLRNQRTTRGIRAIRHKYRVYDLTHKTRWYSRIWCAVVVAFWTLKGTLK